MRYATIGLVVVALLMAAFARPVHSGVKAPVDVPKAVALPPDQPVYYVYPDASGAPAYSGVEITTLLLSVIGTVLGGAALAEAKTGQRQAQEAKAAAEAVRKLVEERKR